MPLTNLTNSFAALPPLPPPQQRQQASPQQRLQVCRQLSAADAEAMASGTSPRIPTLWSTAASPAAGAKSAATSATTAAGRADASRQRASCPGRPAGHSASRAPLSPAAKHQARRQHTPRAPLPAAQQQQPQVAQRLVQVAQAADVMAAPRAQPHSPKHRTAWRLPGIRLLGGEAHTRTWSLDATPESMPPTAARPPSAWLLNTFLLWLLVGRPTEVHRRPLQAHLGRCHSSCAMQPSQPLAWLRASCCGACMRAGAMCRFSTVMASQRYDADDGAIAAVRGLHQKPHRAAMLGMDLPCPTGGSSP